MVVAQHLDFNMPGKLEELLEIEFGIPESAERFLARGRDRRRKILGLADDAHSTAATAT